MLKKSVIATCMLIFLSSAIAVASGKSAAAPPVIVETLVIKMTEHNDQVSSTGSFLSIPGIVVKPEISGRITKICFISGQTVKKGEPLIEINPNIIKAELEQAVATMELNNLNFKRSLLLYKTRDISKSDLDQAQANYVSAKAKVDSAIAQFEQTTIKAPFDGKLGLSQVNVGDYVTAGQSIVNLQTLDPLKLDFTVPEAYQSRVAIGQEVLVRTDTYPNKTFSGNVEAIESLINPNNRTLNVRANVPNSDGKLIPGGFAVVTLRFGKEEVISVPQPAIIYDASGNYVYKVVDGKAVKVDVTLGDKGSDDVIVKSGLKVGDVVVTAGQLKLSQGALVVIAGR